MSDVSILSSLLAVIIPVIVAWITTSVATRNYAKGGSQKDFAEAASKAIATAGLSADTVRNINEQLTQLIKDRDDERKKSNELEKKNGELEIKLFDACAKIDSMEKAREEEMDRAMNNAIREAREKKDMQARIENLESELNSTSAKLHQMVANYSSVSKQAQIKEVIAAEQREKDKKTIEHLELLVSELMERMNDLIKRLNVYLLRDNLPTLPLVVRSGLQLKI